MNTMFVSLPPKPQSTLSVADLKASPLGVAALAEARLKSEELLSFSERGALARTHYLTTYESRLAELAFLDKLGDQFPHTFEFSSSAQVSAYILEAVRVVRANRSLCEATVTLFAAGQAALPTLEPGELTDLLSSPDWAAYRARLVATSGLLDAHNRPLIEAVRLFKFLALGAGEWSPARLQALPLIWTRHGVQASLCFELLITLVVLEVLQSTPPNTTPLVTLIEKLSVAVPATHSEIMLRAERAQKAQAEAILADHGLAPVDIFSLMNVPLGPIRGQVIANIKLLLADPETPVVNFGEHDHTLRTRARAARQALSL
jgi:hypothetical protein